MSNIFKVNNKDTRTTSGASVVNFEHISHFILLLLLLNSNKKNVSWAREIIVPDNKFTFSNCEKYIVLWAGENCLVTSFHSYLSNIRLREKCPNTELFLIRIFLYSDWIRRDLPYLSVFSPNTGKYGQEITPYLDTFHAVKVAKVYKFWRRISKRWVEPCCFVDGIPP